MQELGKNDWQEEILDLIEKMKEKDMLSEEVKGEVDSLLEEGRYSKAGRIAVNNQSGKQVFAD